MSSASATTEGVATGGNPGSRSGPRAVALVGPQGSGKSTLFDALLAAAGGTARRADPRARRAAGEMRLAQCAYLGESWSLLDCPGSVEFGHDALCALAVVDAAVVVCDPDPDRALAVAPLLRALARLQLPHVLFINRVDTLTGRVRDTLAALQAHSPLPLVLRQVPIRTEGGEPAVTGYVDLVSERAYRYRRGEASELMQMPATMRARETEARESLLEVLADQDDALMSQILEDIVPSPAELYAHLRKDLAEDRLVEVLLGAAEHAHGVRRLWKALRHDVPGPAVTAARLGIAPDGPALAQVFRTAHAGHAGKQSLARIWRGSIADGSTLNGARLGGIQQLPAGEPQRASQAEAGEVVALGRLEGAQTGAVLIAEGEPPALPFPTPAAPVHALAIATEQRADDVKLSGALQKLMEEDPALTLTQDPQTGETVLHGQGEIHLNAAVERLRAGFGLKLATARPAVPFKETIRQPVQQHARLKRQTGGHGQFADVTLAIAPRGRGEGFLFIDRITGGVVPRQYIPAVGEAAEEAARKGPLGNPVVDISVTLLDGTFHSVDSSDMAFRTATRMAMQEGLARADPVLLEPVDHVTVTVPNVYTANAQRLLSGRRGRILGYAESAEMPGWDEVEAQVPQAELADLIIELRSQTLGLGSYRRRFDHLAEASGRSRAG